MENPTNFEQMPAWLYKAIHIAYAVHEGQLYGEVPYIVHPEGVAESALLAGYYSPEILAACWLHDVLEDSNITPEDLRRLEIPEVVITALGLLNTSGIRESRVKVALANQHPISHVVKLLDARYNLKRSLELPNDDPKRELKIENYTYMVNELTAGVLSPEDIDKWLAEFKQPAPDQSSS